MYGSLGGINFYFLEVVGIWGQFGCVLFIIISSWFLCDANGFSFKHTAKLIISVWIICFLIVVLDRCGGSRLSISDIAKELLTPAYNQYWFITTYLFFSMLEPFIRKWNRNNSIEFQLKLVLILTILIPVYNLLFSASPGYHLADFFYLYFFTSYLKHKKNNIVERNSLVLFTISTFLVWASVHISGIILRRNHLEFVLEGLYNRLWGINPIIITGAMSLFYVIEKKAFYNRAINYLGKRTLGVYVLHENLLMRGGNGKASLLWDGFFRLSYKYETVAIFPLLFIVSVLFTFIVATIIDGIISWGIKRVMSTSLLNDLCEKITLFYTGIIESEQD